jgi:acyl-CoA reductase-like NAD-dependent aldehyde dehydrogenase
MMADISFAENFVATIDGAREPVLAILAVVNPATETVFAQAPDCTAEQLDRAVAAARRSFPAWAATPIEARAMALRRIAERIDKHTEALSLLLTLEQGKPLQNARAEIGAASRWFSHLAQSDLPTEHKTLPDGRVAEIRRVPLGVVGAIAPWNFPVSLAVWKVAPALLAGNTIVLKPSPFTPLTTLKLSELMLDLLPPGVLNTVSGADHLGPLMSGHEGIDKIAFTGSTATGKAVMRSAAGTLKRLTLELGGNDPAIVLADVDVEAVAEKLFWGAFTNAGQICVAAKRIYVHNDIYDRFAARMAELARENAPGDGTKPNVKIGPVQNRLQFERVSQMIAAAEADGLCFLSGATRSNGPGYFIAPTIVDNPPDDSPVVREEPFGPLLPLMRFTSIDDAVRRANDSEYGLASSVWSADLEKASAVGRRLQAGTVWINQVLGISPALPFGGHKQSGFGVENAQEGLHEYTNIQVIVT